MTHAPRNDSTEQRRRLLKGALGASTVVTLGYGAPAAAASHGCIAEVRVAGGGYPAISKQFVLGENPPPIAEKGNWAWEEVRVHTYQVATPTKKGSKQVDGFVVNNRVYSTTFPHDELLNATEVPLRPGRQQVAQKKGWVLVYFDDNGVRQGTYPEYRPGNAAAAPATASCLASVNPGAVAGFRFGG
ncbi:hypothetical protein [Thauera sp.]|uniref:hypothetical protein n=1 Tax=Thauera sp. TaxID=1905334 RepID=UPI0039E5D629